MKILCIFIVLLTISISVYSQEYIIFEEKNTINSREVVSGLNLSLNNINLMAGDTSINLYNWFFSPQLGFKWKSVSANLSILSPKLLNNLIIVAVPINQNEQKNYRKLSIQELKELKIISIDSLLERALHDLNRHMQPRTVLMPPLKTLQYGLILKRNNAFYLVHSPILVAYFVVSHEPTYFPNEFRNGVLSINQKNANYDYKTISDIEKELRRNKLPHKWLEKIVNRIYLSHVDTTSSFHKPIFSFWEYPDEDVISSLLNLKQLHEFNMGLGSFQFIDGIGVVNATLDTFIKHKILFQQKPYFTIKKINGMDVDKFISESNRNK